MFIYYYVSMLLLSFALSIAIYTIWLNAKLGVLISLGVFAVVVVAMFWWKVGGRGIFQ
jgi:hypothetical protein